LVAENPRFKVHYYLEGLAKKEELAQLQWLSGV